MRQFANNQSCIPQETSPLSPDTEKGSWNQENCKEILMGRETEPQIETEVLYQELEQSDFRIYLENPPFIEYIYEEVDSFKSGTLLPSIRVSSNKIPVSTGSIHREMF